MKSSFQGYATRIGGTDLECEHSIRDSEHCFPYYFTETTPPSSIKILVLSMLFSQNVNHSNRCICPL